MPTIMSRTDRRALIAALPASLFMLLLGSRLGLAQGSFLDQGKALLNKEGVPGLGGSGAKSALSTGDISSGLKEALRVGCDKTIGQIGKADGFFKDPAIKIPLPGALEKVHSMLSGIGAGGMLDDLQLKMNRGAEQAVPQGKTIFVNSIQSMSIDDARGILSGPADAATQYFKRTTTDPLSKAFHPIVDKSLSSVGAVQQLNAVNAKASSLPFGESVKGFDLTDFVVGKGLDGLFHYIAQEEAAIRANPAARTTGLLKKVFA